VLHVNGGIEMDYKKLGLGLGFFSIALGLTEVAAPGRLARFLGVEGKTAKRIIGLFGARELLAGAMTLATKHVVYSTCSLEPEENDAVVAGYDRLDIAPFVPEGARKWVTDGVLRLTPESGADGFTAFVLRPR